MKELIHDIWFMSHGRVESASQSVEALSLDQVDRTS
jgi:hypothetical protein